MRNTKFFDRLIYDIFYNIFKGFLLIFLFPILSRVTKWNYPRFIERFSVKDWILFYIMILLFAVYIFYRKRTHVIEERNLDRKTAVRRLALHGEEKIGFLNYKDVFWDLLIPADTPVIKLNLSSGTKMFSEPSDKERLLKIKPNDIDLLGPLCPKCGELFEESEIFFGRYIWECTECEFKKKNKYSYHDEWKKALLIAREEFKKFRAGLEPKNIQLYSKFL